MKSSPESFDLQPTLEGERVLIRPINASDWEGMFKAASNPEVWSQHPISDRYTEPVFRYFFNGAIDSGSAFAFVDKESNEIIGSSRYHGLDPDLSEIEVGWTFLDTRYWGGSYNREVKKLMLEHAFKYVETVVFWVGDTNYRSRKAMEKIGGVLRDGFVYRNLRDKSYAHVVYEIKPPLSF